LHETWIILAKNKLSFCYLKLFSNANKFFKIFESFCFPRLPAYCNFNFNFVYVDNAG